jgi:hypothetical protein
MTTSFSTRKGLSVASIKTPPREVDLVGEHLALPAPPPNNGLAESLEEAKQQFKLRYEETKAAGVKFPDD